MIDEQQAATFCGVDGHRVLTVGYICPQCRDRLVDDLREVERRYPLLDARYAVDPETRHGGGFGSRPPGRIDIWTARDERSLPYKIAEDWLESDTPVRSVCRTLSSWADLIVETRGEQTPPPTDVPGLVEWLIRRVGFIERWPDDGPALALDVRLLRNSLRSLTGAPNPRPSAWCIAFVDGEECGAAIFLPERSDLAQVPVLWCTGRPQHRYTGSDLLRLKIANEEAAR